MSQGAHWQVNEGFEAEWEGSSARATEVVLNVIRAGERLGALVGGVVRAHGLPSTTALIVLEVLRGDGGPLQPSVIASRSFLSRPALSSVLTTLEQRQLVTRAPHPVDRRQSLVEITARGVALMEALLPVLHRAERTFVDPALTSRQQEALLDLLGRLQTHLLIVDDKAGDQDG